MTLPMTNPSQATTTSTSTIDTVDYRSTVMLLCTARKERWLGVEAVAVQFLRQKLYWGSATLGPLAAGM
eukprot:2575996-Rhodomonas_salina.1